MRTAEVERLITVGDGPDDLLTTGEAAAILGSTRQHVVNLVHRGDIDSTLVGSHHRVRRSDVEAIKQSSIKLTRDQTRSLWLGHALAGRIVTDPEAAAEDAGLRYVSDDRPGFTRKPKGDDFEYCDTTAKPITDEAKLLRIKRLAVPPAYTDVWICPTARGFTRP